MSVAQFSDVEQCSAAFCRMDLWFQGINEISSVIRKEICLYTFIMKSVGKCLFKAFKQSTFMHKLADVYIS